MTHEMMVLVFQLAVILVATQVFGFVFERWLRLPKVIGELCAGMLIGPYLLGSLSIGLLGGPLFPLTGESVLPVDANLYGFATVASVVLLFLSGLETDLPTFIRFSGKAALIGLGGVLASFIFGGAITVLMLPGVNSFTSAQAIFMGILASTTSVGITARILTEKKKMTTPEGASILAAAVLDDVLGIVLLAVAVGMSKLGSGSGEAIHWLDILILALKVFGFWLISTVAGILLGPKLVWLLKKFRSIEILTVLVFGIALLLAGLAESVGLAMIIGAYVSGLAFSQTDAAHEIRATMQSIHDFFVPVFFCVMGMMVNFAAIGPVLVFGLIFALLAMFAKLIGCGLPALMTGFNLRGALRIGCGMLPRGEVALIVAGIGLGSGVIGHDLFGVAIITLLLASLTAPLLLVKVFEGGEGYRRDLQSQDDQGLSSLQLKFPSPRMSQFMLEQILESFSREDFFIQSIDSSSSNQHIYHIRKDQATIVVIGLPQGVTINVRPEYEQLVRLLLLEEIVNLKDFLAGFESMGNPDSMGADLLRGMFRVQHEHDDGPPQEEDSDSQE